MDTSSDIRLLAPGRRRGRYSEAFKARMVQACTEPGVSTAAVALANGLNANLLRRWVHEHRQTHGPEQAGAEQGSDFVQIAAAGAQRGAQHGVAALPPTSLGPADHDRMQLHFSRGDLRVSLSIPAHHHAPCAALLKLMLS